MQRLSHHVLRGLMALAFVGSFGFGATQALAAPEAAATVATCPVKGYDYYYASCAYNCPLRKGYCSAEGYCQCGDLP